MTAIYSLNAEHNGVEITFPEKPSAAVIADLKSAGFRWHGKKKVWYAKQSPDRLALAEKLTNGALDADFPEKEKDTEELIIPETTEIEDGLYSGWKGGNSGTWHSNQELKKLLMADFKKAKIPATIRFNRAGYITSLTVTITISAADILPYEEYAKNYTVPCGWNCYYCDDNGNLMQMRSNDYYTLPADEQSKMRENFCRTAYDIAIDHLTYSGKGNREDVLTEAANKKLETAKAIVNSYNRDQSNSMIDYFDREIYDDYRFKIA